MAKDYSNIEGLIGNVKESIRNAYDKGYKQGFNEGQAHQLASDDVFRESCEKSAYEKGSNDSWECAKKIICDVSYDGYSTDTLRKIFDTANISDIFSIFSPSEAIAKIKEYEEKQKQANDEIKVGDEVVDRGVSDSGKGIVTFVSPLLLYVLWDDGSTGIRKLTDVKKTGRTFPKIFEVLKQLKEENK